MKKFLVIAMVAVGLNACQSMPTSYQGAQMPLAGAAQTVSRDASNNTVVQSAGQQTIVALSQTSSEASRPFAKYGKVFTVSVVNIGKQPIQFGPESVSVEIDGRVRSAMSTGELQAVANKLESDRQDDLNARKIIGGILGQLGGYVGNANVAQALEIGTKVLEISTVQEMQDAEEARAEAAALIQQHANTSLGHTTLSRMKATGGWVLVDGANATQGYRVRVRVGGDVHTFNFGAQQTASR